jgi:cytochrome c553
MRLGAAALAAAALLVSPAALAAGDADAGKQKAAKCLACHGRDGVARLPNAATIAGEHAQYLEKQLKAFRSGERQDPQMSVIAKTLTDEDIADLAAWYSSIKFTVEVPE